ncbi:ferric reductase-like transmembrane domain-containing protein [Patescibacteria group bacterium]
MRKIIQKLTFYALPISLGIVSATLPHKEIFSKFGSAAFILLSANLFLKPISVLYKHKYLQLFMTYRRELGVASFWFYLAHSTGFFRLYGLTSDSFLNTNSFLFYGGVAAFGMWLLALTSNDYSIRFLKKNWKTLHRLSYLIFYFALYHSSRVEQEMEKFFIFGSLFLILKIIQFKKTQKI